jgi:shikimate kinase
MRGKAQAPGVITVINAIGPLKGSSFAVNRYTEAEVEISPKEDSITGEIIEAPEEETDLIEKCVELVLDRYDVDAGAHVETRSEIPMASGMASSSAAANAAVLATLDAINENMEKKEATRIGVQAAIDAGVSVTGAIDDAWASMLGGIVMSDNEKDRLIEHENFDYNCTVYIPDSEEKTADTDIERSKQVAHVVEEAFSMALDGKYEAAMTTNGFAYCAALGFDEEKIMEALEHVEGANLSGTGPSFAAIGTEDEVRKVAEKWRKYDGEVLMLETDNQGGKIL